MARDAECLSEFVSRRKFGTASGAASVAALAECPSEASESGDTPRSGGGGSPEHQRAEERITGKFG